MKNNKGFMMAEVVVVSAIILVVLGVMFVSYSKLLTLYSSRVGYYDTVTLYRIGFYRNILIENLELEKTMTEAKKNKVVSVYQTGSNTESIFQLPAEEQSDNAEDRVFMIYNGKQNLTGDELDSQGNTHLTFKDYIKYLSTSADLTKTNYVMVMERCTLINGVLDEDNCKYGFLEVYDGYE